ncbi:cytochrome c oxidase assembly protein COX11, mitochondrial-like [Condylostylus longicornis]|uniref:cytochrome c oxidase assembly protein COX11, mitochondrial-like n=1 Tax=Condylostylus longicornis TaxID=2530218 RepID=UPI00244D9CB8|nr:cytochrome c oxidase assembly protein COX11, mitochondrial-like [Condylostylus longicornis]XP_055382275.1 cytochrome c oxidase assembly protein COX11, mitochondrial-like [Condylostylus longicornis]
MLQKLSRYIICNKSVINQFFSIKKRNIFQTKTNFQNNFNRSDGDARKRNIKSTLYYVSAAGVLVAGFSYAAVPLYRMFCQAYSYGGTTSKGHDVAKVEHMKKIENRQLKIKFNADLGASMRWNFKPQQYEIKVVPGETALAFYTARNPTDKPVTGISTYNVIPFEAGQYFNKIQCFCFEEQQLNPNEEVDMPVFFYIDPEFVDDPKMELVDTITLSYTFFETKDGFNIPMPEYAKPH